MNKLTKWLQTNPYVILAMFVVSLLSGLVGLLLSWKQLYQDFLSKTVELPVWLLAVFFLVNLMVVALVRKGTEHATPKELKHIEGKRFGVQQIVLDGISFERCEFHGTETIFEGREAFALSHCRFDAPRFTFSKYATNTVSVLTAMYSDPAFRPIVESVLTNIREGRHPEAVPLSNA